jgi:hypothetical protein
VASPTLKMAPSPAEVEAITCPFDRAALITELARACGTLPKALSDLRKAALDEARAARHSARTIADRVGISRARVFQLTRRPALPREAAP